MGSIEALVDGGLDKFNVVMADGNDVVDDEEEEEEKEEEEEDRRWVMISFISIVTLAPNSKPIIFCAPF